MYEDANQAFRVVDEAVTVMEVGGSVTTGDAWQLQDTPMNVEGGFNLPGVKVNEDTFGP